MYKDRRKQLLINWHFFYNTCYICRTFPCYICFWLPLHTLEQTWQLCLFVYEMQIHTENERILMWISWSIHSSWIAKSPWSSLQNHFSIGEIVPLIFDCSSMLLYFFSFWRIRWNFIFEHFHYTDAFWDMYMAAIMDATVISYVCELPRGVKFECIIYV